MLRTKNSRKFYQSRVPCAPPEGDQMVFRFSRSTHWSSSPAGRAPTILISTCRSLPSGRL